MALSEQSRTEVFEAAEKALGRKQALTLMEMLPPVGWADVATKHDLDIKLEALKFELRGEIIEVKSELTDKIANQTRTTVLAMITLLLGSGFLQLAAAKLG